VVPRKSLWKKLFVASFLLLVFLSALSFGKAEPGWWNENWNFRRPVTVSGSHPENYHLKIVVPYDENMQPDYDDLRFLENETSGELDYWVENYTPDNVTVWVKRQENTDNKTFTQSRVSQSH